MKYKYIPIYFPHNEWSEHYKNKNWAPFVEKLVDTWKDKCGEEPFNVGYSDGTIIARCVDRDGYEGFIYNIYCEKIVAEPDKLKEPKNAF